MKTDLKKENQLKKILPLSIFLLILLSIGNFVGKVSADAFKGPVFSNDGPEAVLKHCVNQSISILNDPVYKGKSKKEILQKVLFEKCEPTFDFKALSMGVLGRNWRRFSEKQRDDFSKYFSHLIAQVYFEKLNKKSIDDIKKAIKEISIQYIKTTILPPTRSGIKRVDITTEVMHNGVKTPIIFRMLKRKQGQWKIYDLKIEGVSLLANYRAQYRNKFMETPDQIIAELKKKVEK